MTPRRIDTIIPRWFLPPMVERMYNPRRPGSIRTLNWLTGRCWAEQIDPRGAE